jgi:hypothetical protein
LVRRSGFASRSIHAGSRPSTLVTGRASIHAWYGASLPVIADRSAGVSASRAPTIGVTAALTNAHTRAAHAGLIAALSGSCVAGSIFASGRRASSSSPALSVRFASATSSVSSPASAADARGSNTATRQRVK